MGQLDIYQLYRSLKAKICNLENQVAILNAGTIGISNNKIEFKVTTTSFIVAGATAKLINGTDIYNFVGYNLIFIRNGVPQNSINSGGTYFTWDKVTGLFTVIGGAELDETFQIFAI